MTHRNVERPLDLLEKGVPNLAMPIQLSEVAAQQWNLLREDLPLPAAIIKTEALRHNSLWMKRFVAQAGVEIAPHGKTSMSPALFDLQIDDGAWGITLSTVHQLRVARSFGFDRIFFANQLVGRASLEYVIEELRDHPEFIFHCLVDSAGNAAAIAAAARRLGLVRPVNVLVELGQVGERTGCRSVEEALALARRVSETEGIALSGIEGFEGLIKGPTPQAAAAKVGSFLDDLVRLARACDAAGLFAGPVILSAGGSSYFDLVAKKLSSARLNASTTVLLRSGCYITHDAAMYVRAFEALADRSPMQAAVDGGLRQALEVWAYVHSRPDVDKAIIGFGKRDASHDELPIAQRWFRPGSGAPEPLDMPAGHVVQRLNDQHCHMSIPPDSPLAVGDMIGFGISHPCLTLDKWRVLLLVDAEYNVQSSIRTYF